MHISTFHSFCAEFIRENAAKCSVSEQFKILEELDAAILLKRKLGIETPDAKRYANTIGKAKDLAITIDDYRKYLESQENLLANFYPKEKWKHKYEDALVRLRTIHLDIVEDKDDKKQQKEEKAQLIEFIELYENYSKYRDFVDAWERYEELKRKSNALDYADLNKLVLEFTKTYGRQNVNNYCT